MDWRIIGSEQRRKRSPSPNRQPARKTNRGPGKTTGRGWAPSHRSQNRVFQETFVYVMANFPFFMVNKFGITDKTVARRKNVSETTPGLVFTILPLNLAFGFEVEQFVHRVYKLQNVHFWTGSGRTEWFIVFSPIVGCSMLYLNYRFGWALTAKQLGLSFFMPFVWWDGLLWLLIFKAIKLVVVIVLFLCVVYILANMK